MPCTLDSSGVFFVIIENIRIFKDSHEYYDDAKALLQAFELLELSFKGVHEF